MLIVLFLIRLCAGMVSGYLNLYHFYNSDTKGFHERGLVEYHLLIDNPTAYLKNIFIDPHGNTYGGFFSISKSYWNDLKNNLMDKIHSVFDIFSFGNYYINIVCFNFLVFIASISLYKYFLKIFPERKIELLISIFLLPCFLYFSSTLHRDGMVFILLVMIIVNFSNLLKGERKIASLIYFLIAFSLILFLRNFICLLMIPGLISWFISNIYHDSKTKIFIITYIIFILLFVSSGWLSNGRVDMMKIISERQEKYIELSTEAKSKIPATFLAPNINSFISHLPRALDNAFLRPHLLEQKEVYSMLFSLEMDGYFVMLILFFLLRRKNDLAPVCRFCLFLSASIFLLIGFTVPISITIIRYKSAFIPFMIIPVLCSIDYKKIVRVINR